MAILAKRIETRSWKTSYTGELAIHAAKGMPVRARRIIYEEPFYSVLVGAGYLGTARMLTLPRGCIVATVRLVVCRPTVGMLFPPGSLEPAFGDFTPGRWAWITKDLCPLPEPIPAQGALGLWEWIPPQGYEYVIDKGDRDCDGLR